ncbi:hypothetical protein P9112_013814 [Eukaryota sp. TZLM1-RC]
MVMSRVQSAKSFSNFLDVLNPSRRSSVSGSETSEKPDDLMSANVVIAPLPSLAEEQETLDWMSDDISEMSMVDVYERFDDYLAQNHDNYQIVAPTLEIDFMLKLIFALTLSGMPSTHIEELLVKIAQRLGFDCSISVQPRQVSVCFTSNSDSSHLSSKTRTFIVHTEDVGSITNVSSLDLLYTLGNSMAEGRLSLESGFKGLLDIISNPPEYGKKTQIIAGGFASSSLAGLFFQCNIVSMLLALFGGILEQSVEHFVCQKYQKYGRVHSFVTTFIFTILLSILRYTVPSLKFDMVSTLLMSLMWILPGLSLASSLTELGRRNMSVGTSRLFYALLTSVIVSYGVLVALHFFGLLFDDFDINIDNVEVEWDVLFLSIFTLSTALSFALLIHAPVALWPTCVVSSFISFYVYYLVNKREPGFAVLAAAAAGGVYSRIWSKFSGKTLNIPLNSCIIMLVPGSLSVRSVLEMFSGSDLGLEMSAKVLQTAIGISLGVIITTSM